MGHDRWDSAVVYQIYWRSFMDANQDGIGDASINPALENRGIGDKQVIPDQLNAIP